MSTINLDISARADLVVRKDNTNTIVLTCTKGGSALSLIAFTFQLVIYDRAGTAVKTVTGTKSSNTVTFVIGSLAAYSSEVYTYKVKVTDVDSNINHWLVGYFIVVSDVMHISGDTPTVTVSADEDISVAISQTVIPLDAPTLVSAAIEDTDQSTIALVYSRTLYSDTPPTSAYSVATKTVDTISISTNTVSVRFTENFEWDDVVTLDFTQGTPTLKDQYGNVAGNLNDQSVTNNVVRP